MDIGGWIESSINEVALLLLAMSGTQFLQALLME